MDQRPHRLAESLQTHRKEGYCARNVPGERPQSRGLPYVDLDELPEQKMGGQLNLHGRIPGRDFIEIAGELAGKPVGVLPVLSRPERLPVLRRECQPVDHPQGENGRFTHPFGLVQTRRSCHSSVRSGPWVNVSYIICEIAAIVRERPDVPGSHSVSITSE